MRANFWRNRLKCFSKPARLGDEVFFMLNTLAWLSIAQYIYCAMHTPFFPQFRARFATLANRVHTLRQQSLSHLDLLFGPLLPTWLLSQTDEGPNSRQHIYSLRRTFFGFLYQALNPDCPCREVVRQIQSLFALLSPRRISEDTGAYCLARGRLPFEILARLRCAVAAHASKAEELWNGFRLRVIDGTGISMPDTPRNQRAYP